jgi:hypothetical protein
MTATIHLTCDGCGQLADAEHFARRLRRLEWATRYRPVHIQALLLGGVAPKLDSEFLFAPDARFQGESGNILQAAQVPTEGRLHDAILSEFQKLGLMLTYILECPLENSVEPGQTGEPLEKHLPAALARIRRSLRPKRIVLFSAELVELAPKLRHANLGCPIWPASGRTLDLAGGFRTSREWGRQTKSGVMSITVGGDYKTHTRNRRYKLFGMLVVNRIAPPGGRICAQSG